MLEFIILNALVLFPYAVIIWVIAWGLVLYFLKKFLGPHN